MAQSFKETAHLRTNKKNFDEGWERIFGTKTENCLKCDLCHAEHETVSKRVDPYAHEIHGDDKEIRICDKCHEQAYMDI